MQFLDEHVFQTPEWLLDPGLLRLIEPAGAIERMRSRQVALLDNLLHPARLQRLTEAQTVDERDAYDLLTFMDDLTRIVWREIESRRPVVDTYRRNLQRGYLERMEYLMTEEFSTNFASFYGTEVDVSQSDIRPVVRAQLNDIRNKAFLGSTRSRDLMTRHHLEDVVARIDDLLDAKD